MIRDVHVSKKLCLKLAVVLLLYYLDDLTFTGIIINYLLLFKGSKSEAVFDCPPNLTSPILFRFKKNRPKKVCKVITESKTMFIILFDICCKPTLIRVQG